MNLDILTERDEGAKNCNLLFRNYINPHKLKVWIAINNQWENTCKIKGKETITVLNSSFVQKQVLQN